MLLDIGDSSGEAFDTDWVRRGVMSRNTHRRPAGGMQPRENKQKAPAYLRMNQILEKDANDPFFQGAYVTEDRSVYKGWKAKKSQAQVDENQKVGSPEVWQLKGKKIE